MSDARLVVLDLDGTLVRLRVDWGDVREQLAWIADAHDVETRDSRVLGMLRAARGCGAREAADAMERVVAEAELRAAERSPTNAALLEWVEELPADTSLAVLSLNCRDAIARSLERAGLAGRVGAVIGREDVGRHKPDPEGLLRIMARHGEPPQRTLMVGDSDTDHACARAAGARSLDVARIGVRWEAA